MKNSDLSDEAMAAWRVHNQINLFLLDAIPKTAFSAVRSGSRGRTMSEQFFHMNRVRLGWLEYPRLSLGASFLTNLKSPDELRMTRLVMSFPDKDHLIHEWTSKAREKEHVGRFEFTRKK